MPKTRWDALTRLAALRVGLVCLLLGTGLQRYAVADEGWAHVTGGTVVLFRHALAPGGGDPPGHRLDDCSTQRNLSNEGKAQAGRIGAEFTARNIKVGAVWSSQWCRTRDTADLAFPGRRIDQPDFNSFFNASQVGPAQTQAARRLLQSWRGPGVLVVFTHQVNITALTNIVPSSGEGVVLKPLSGELQLLSRVTP